MFKVLRCTNCGRYSMYRTTFFPCPRCAGLLMEDEATMGEIEEIILDLSGRAELTEDEVKLFQEAWEELEREDV